MTNAAAGDHAALNRRLAELLGYTVRDYHGMGAHYRLVAPDGCSFPMRYSEQSCWDLDCPKFSSNAITCLYAWEWLLLDERWDGKPIFTVRFDYRDNEDGAYFAHLCGVRKHGRPRYVDDTGREGATELEARVRCMIATLDALAGAGGEGDGE